MQLKAFYESVLPTEGQFILFQNKSHTFHESIDALVAATEKRIDTQGLYFATAAFDPDKMRAAREAEKLWLAAQAQGQAEGKKPALRAQVNVLALKSLRVDIDAGVEKFAKHPDGAYPTQRDALAALIAFVKTTELVPTLIVSSGEGLHVYWCLEEAVDPVSWHGASLLLNAVGRAQDLRIDAGCTADSARVLRPVGTLHKNGSRVAVLRDTGRVWDFRTLDDKLRSFDLPVEEAFALQARAPKSRAPSINDDILKPVEGPPSSLARVAEHCSAVAAMRDNEGNVPEPHWRAVMGVAKYCEDGEDLVHQWSAGYPGYNPRETQEKFDRWETPPTTCQHFSMMHSGCNTCPHKGKITTPKQVGYIVITPVAPTSIPDAPAPEMAAAEAPDLAALEDGVTDPQPPSDTSMALGDEVPEGATPECPVPDRPDLFDEESPFFYKVVDNRWTLFHTYQEASKDATGQTVYLKHTKPVAYKLFWVDSNSLPGATDTGGVVIQFGRVERPGTVRQERMDMPAGLAADIKNLAKFLVDQGINIAPRSTNKNAVEHVKEYVIREIIRKQNDMRFVLKDRFGYHYHEGQFLCSMGQFTVYPDGSVIKTICNSKLLGLARSLTTSSLPAQPSGRWEPATWREVAPHVSRYIQFLRNHYGRDGFENARLAIAINLASPFLVFAGDSAFTEDAEELPATGFVLSLYSEASGIGKSSLMAAIAAAYGKDTLARKGNDQSITAVAAATTAKNTGIYPFLLDEVTQNEAHRAAQIIDTFANGSGRLRAKSDGSVSKSAETWALVSCVATNVPQRELLTAAQKRSDALLMRLMELDFDEIPRTGNVEQFRAELKGIQEKCGAFGMFQALLAVKAGPRKLTDMTSANVTKAFAILQVGQQFRFFARMLGAMLTNHELLGRWSPFDMDDIVRTFKRAIRDTMWYVQANRMGPEGELNSLVNAMSANVAVTKTWSTRGTADVLLNTNVKLPLVGREVQDEGIVYLECGHVRRWCLEQQVSATAFLKKMETAGLLVTHEEEQRLKRRITTGILGLPTTSGYYYKFRTRPAEAAAEAAAEDGDNVVPLRSGVTA